MWQFYVISCQPVPTLGGFVVADYPRMLLLLLLPLPVLLPLLHRWCSFL